MFLGEFWEHPGITQFAEFVQIPGKALNQCLTNRAAGMKIDGEKPPKAPAPRQFAASENPIEISGL